MKLEASMQLWDAQDVLGAVFHALPLGVCITDARGTFVYVNEAFCRIYKYEPEDLVGRSFLTVVPEEHHALLQELHDDFLLRGRDEMPGRYEVVRSDGATIPISVTASRFEGRGGAPFKVTTVTDVSETVRLEKMRADAERVVRHDLKAPLSSIVSLADLLLDERQDRPLDPEQQEYAGYIREKAYAMQGMLDHAMDLFRLEEGSYEVQAAPFNLGEALGRAAGRLATLRERKDLRLRYEVDERPVEKVTEVAAHGEERLVAAMLEHLLQNALEASPDGADVVVRVGSDGSGGLEVVIANQGAVPEAVRGCLFERHSSCGKAGRSGQGAYAAALIARAHGGSVGFESRDGATEFTVRLPGGP